MQYHITKHAIDRFKEDVIDKKKKNWNDDQIIEFLTNYAKKAKRQKINILGKHICRGYDSKDNNTYKYYHWYLAIVEEDDLRKVTTVMHKKSKRRIFYEKLERPNNRISHIRYIKKKEEELIQSLEI